MRSPTEGELLENVSAKKQALRAVPAPRRLYPGTLEIYGSLDYIFCIIFVLSPAGNVPLCSYVNLSVLFIV